MSWHRVKDHGQPPIGAIVRFVFESQLLDSEGRVLIRQPAIEEARVYCVCMKCRGWTYVVTNWVGYYLGSPDDVLPTSTGEAQR